MLEVYLLGQISFRLNGEWLDAAFSNHLKALLVYLICEKKSYSRSYLAQLLWDVWTREDHQKALGRLRVNLSDRLPTELKNYLKQSEPNKDLWFDTTQPFVLDVDTLKLLLEVPNNSDAIANSRLAIRIERALALYRGDFLEGFDIRTGSKFEFWLQQQRQTIRASVLTALKKLIDFYSVQQQYAAALTYARRLQELEPLDEENIRNLMDMLAKTGQRTAALKYFKTFKLALSKEWDDIEPEESTLQLYQQIKAGKNLSALNIETTTDDHWAGNPVRYLVDQEGLGSQLELLREVPLFVNSPPALLVDLTQLLKRVEVKAGQTLFEKDQPGDCMYIVAEGCLKAHQGQNVLSCSYKGDILGEMALLDRVNRMATITAIEDSVVLALEREDFYDLLFDRPEVSRGIIQVLSQRLRERVDDLKQLRTALLNNGNNDVEL